MTNQEPCEEIYLEATVSVRLTAEVDGHGNPAEIDDFDAVISCTRRDIVSYRCWNCETVFDVTNPGDEKSAEQAWQAAVTHLPASQSAEATL